MDSITKLVVTALGVFGAYKLFGEKKEPNNIPFTTPLLPQPTTSMLPQSSSIVSYSTDDDVLPMVEPSGDEYEPTIPPQKRQSSSPSTINIKGKRGKVQVKINRTPKQAITDDEDGEKSSSNATGLSLKEINERLNKIKHGNKVRSRGEVLPNPSPITAKTPMPIQPSKPTSKPSKALKQEQKTAKKRVVAATKATKQKEKQEAKKRVVAAKTAKKQGEQKKKQDAKVRLKSAKATKAQKTTQKAAKIPKPAPKLPKQVKSFLAIREKQQHTKK